MSHHPVMVPCFWARHAATAIAIGVTAIVALGCGSSQAPRLAKTSADGLHQAIAGVRASVGAGERAKALSTLSSLSQLVAREADAGHLSAADADAMRTGITRARRRVTAEIPVRAPAPAPAPIVSAPAPAPAPPAATTKAPKEDKQGGGKKGKGHKR